MINGKMRFIDQIGMNEIIPIIGAVSMLDHWRGRSKLNQIVYDIAMSTDGKRHNVSLLKNGLRTSGILSPRTDTTGSNKWDDKKVKALEQNIRNFHQGSENAGNILILGAPAQIDGITQNNKDMDFIALLKESKVEIYNAYKIPLPLVLSESMTYDNLTTSQRAYYDKAVFPVFNMLADGIMSGLGERYGLEENEKLSFSVLAIRDLQSVLAEDMTQLKNTEVVRVNEIRAIGGLKPDMDGDVILVGAGKLPLQAVSIGPLPEESNPTPYKPTETVPPEDNMDDETEDDTTD
jgi:HK97 family phage portal protein